MGRFNFYIISMLAALKRLLTAKRFREAYGGLMDVTGMVLLLDVNESARRGTGLVPAISSYPACASRLIESIS